MKVKVVSCVPITGNDGKVFYRVFAQTSDGLVGNLWTSKQYKSDDEIDLVLSVSKDCKFVVRPSNH